MIKPAYEILNQRGTPMFFSDVFANRPNAGIVGRIFISTDTFAFYRDNGVTWDLIGGPGTGTITGSGTAFKYAVFTASQEIGNGSIEQFTSENKSTKDFVIDSGIALSQLTINSTADSLIKLSNATDYWTIKLQNIFGESSNSLIFEKNDTGVISCYMDGNNIGFEGITTFSSPNNNDGLNYFAVDPNLLISATGLTNGATITLKASDGAYYGTIRTGYATNLLRFQTGNNVDRLIISDTGTIQISNLGGSGSQMVVVDNTGLLSKQAIPIAGTIATNQIAYGSASNTLAGSDRLAWDNTNFNLFVRGNNFNVGTYWKTINGTTFPQQNFRGLTYGNGLFVAVANRAGAANSTTTSITTSPDGVIWTYRTLPALTGLTNITYQNGIFIAVGQISQRGFYSYDGINWVVTNGLNGQIYGVTFGKDKFVACKIDNSQGRIAISSDGINWSNVTTPLLMDLPITSIAYGNDVFVAVASNSAADSIWYSPDAITWTAATRTAGTTTYNACYGKGLFIVTADSGKIFTSPDGINWTQRDTPLSSLIWKCIYANGVFIAAGAFASSQNKFIYSVDGTTWLEANTPALNDWGAFAYGNGMVLCVSYSGPNTSALIVKSGETNNFIPQNDNNIYGRQTFTDNVTISGNLTIADNKNIIVGSTNGTKIGTANTQKLSLWNATPIVQPTTGVGSAVYNSPGGGLDIRTDDTFDGYTIQQVVKALRNIGILA